MNRDELIDDLKKRIKDKKVIRAFEEVDRSDFVPEAYRRYAYIDDPLPIAEGQTISQPLTVALMTEALDIRKNHKILEVGTGSGYQAAILSRLCKRVFTTEIRKELFEFASKNLRNYRNVKVMLADGSLGYGKEAPYDRIIVTASAPHIPGPLLKQLKRSGKMVIPVGDDMFLIKGNRKTHLGYFSFVPLRGVHGQPFKAP